MDRCEWPELALDERQRDPFVQQLKGVGMAQLMGSHAPSDTGLERQVMQLGPNGAG